MGIEHVVEHDDVARLPGHGDFDAVVGVDHRLHVGIRNHATVAVKAVARQFVVGIDRQQGLAGLGIQAVGVPMRWLGEETLFTGIRVAHHRRPRLMGDERILAAPFPAVALRLQSLFERGARVGAKDLLPRTPQAEAVGAGVGHAPLTEGIRQRGWQGFEHFTRVRHRRIAAYIRRTNAAERNHQRP